MNYWQWIIFGLVISLVEIFLPSFAILWFGVGAVITGISLIIAPSISFNVQLLIWLLSSISMAIIWFKYFKPTSNDNLKTDKILHSVINETGVVIKLSTDNKSGVLRFSIAFDDSDEWEFTIDDSTIKLGDRVIVTGRQNDTLITKKV